MSEYSKIAGIMTLGDLVKNAEAFFDATRKRGDRLATKFSLPVLIALGWFADHPTADLNDPGEKRTEQVIKYGVPLNTDCFQDVFQVDLKIPRHTPPLPGCAV